MKWERTPEQEIEVIEYERPHTWTMHTYGPLEITFTGTLEPVEEGTRLQVDFDATPHGWFRLVFPFFVYFTRKHEKKNMVRIREAFDARAAAA